MIIKLKRRPLGDISCLSNLNIHPLLKRLYIQRGIYKSEKLSRDIKDLLSYHKLYDINKAVDILYNAIINKKKIVVIGDFDTDGATSTALTVLALRQLGAKEVSFIVPNRFIDGYGLTTYMVEKAEKLGSNIILTVDNGISSHEGVDLAKKKKIIVLITDHHLPGENLPNADAIINPNIKKYSLELKHLAGVGVAFYLLLALQEKFFSKGWFINQKTKIPKLVNLLDLVALGTIADMVPLDTNNRILVYQGLCRIKSGICRPGIRALVEVSKININNICTDDLSFALGPRLNASGRLCDMSLGVMLLLTNNLSEARIIANKLNYLNKIRKKIELNMKIEALSFCKKKIINKKNIPYGLVIYNKKWHQGIIGIIASRIKELFYRPVIIFSHINNKKLKGSVRSISNLNIRNILEKLDKLYPGIILNYGGHAMAAGLIIKKKKYFLFCKYFNKLLKINCNPNIMKNIIWSDGELSEKDITINTAKLIYDGGPWGQNFPNPLFDGKFKLLKQEIVGKKHLKCLLKPLYGNNIINGIAFNINSNKWPNKKIYTAKIAYSLKINEFRGFKKLQILIKNIWPLK